MRFLCGARRLLFVAIVVLVASTDVRAKAIPDDFLITLRRTTCFGTCPAYTVSIDSTGRVTYEGSEYVRVKGRQDTRVPLSRVAALVATVDRIGFFELNDSYTALVTDHPTVFVTVRSGGRTKRIEDYVSGPKSLKALEQQIDETAGTRRWIRIDVPGLEELALKGAAPSREQLDEWLRTAIGHDELDVAKALLELGANPNGAVAPSGSRPLLAAVRSAAAVKLLVDAGADPFVIMADGRTLLGMVSDSPAEVTDALLKLGLSPTPSVLLNAACGGNLPVVIRLLRAGVSPSFEIEGTSPLECARASKEVFSKIPRIDLPESWAPDFDGVILALERASAGRKQR